MLFAAVALAFSTGAIAQNGTVKSTATKLSDAQLDQVTAGQVVVIIANRGGHSSLVQTDGRTLCINCSTAQAMVPIWGYGGLIGNNGSPNGRFIGGWRQ